MAVKRRNPFKKTDPFRQGQSIAPPKITGGSESPSLRINVAAAGEKAPPPISDILVNKRESVSDTAEGVFTHSTTGKPSGISIGGKTYLGLSPQEVSEIAQREGLQAGGGGKLPSIAEATAEARRTMQVATEELPGAENVGAGIGAFSELGAGLPLPERSGLGLLVNSPLGQAFAGDISLEKLKEDEEFSSALLSMTDYMLDNGLTPEAVSSDPQVQMLLRLELTERDIATIKSGKSDVSAIAIAIEGLPVSSQITKWTGGALTPTSAYAKIQALTNKITKIGDEMRDFRMAAARTPAKKDEYLSLIEQAQEEIYDAQSRIKLLIIQSPILQNSPEEVEGYVVSIDRSLKRSADAYNAIYMGETMEQFMMSQQME